MIIYVYLCSPFEDDVIDFVFYSETLLKAIDFTPELTVWLLTEQETAYGSESCRPEKQRSAWFTARLVCSR